MGEGGVKNPEKLPSSLMDGPKHKRESSKQSEIFHEIFLVFLKFLACASIKNKKKLQKEHGKFPQNMMQNISQRTRPLAALNWTTHMSVTDGISDTSFFE